MAELWDELAENPESLGPRQDHIEILDQRLKHLKKNPGDTIAWEDLKAKILASR